MKYFANIFYVLCLIQLGVGAVSGQVGEQLHLATIEQEGAEYDSSVVDTVYSDFPYIKRVYNWGSDGKRGPSVPFVDLDTNTYEKKLWLSEKKLITLPIKSKHAKVVGKDSIVYVAYSSSDAAGWYVNSTYSIDYGRTWSTPQQIQPTGYVAGHHGLVIAGEKIYLSYNRMSPGEFLRELLFRETDTKTFVLSDSVIVDTTFSSSEAVYGPSLLLWGDTLFLSYLHHDDGVNYFRFTKSFDQGASWNMISGDVITVAGKPHFLLLTDTVLSEVCRSGSVEVRIHRSYDGGYTWPEEVYLSAVDQYASQGPAASTDGVSDIHVVWFDHDGAPPGLEGYVFYRRTIDNGNTWDEIKSLSTQPYSASVEICADTNRVYAVWNDGRDIGPPYQALYMRISHDRGETWSPEYKIVPETDPSWYPDIYIDGDLMHLVWMEQDPPEYIQGVYYMFCAWYRPGDVDFSDEVNVADLTYFVAYLFLGGDEPFVTDAAQMDGENGINIADLTYLVDYLFRGGPPPVGGTTGL